MSKDDSDSAVLSAIPLGNVTSMQKLMESNTRSEHTRHVSLHFHLHIFEEEVSKGRDSK
jgi:hypothetical protein